MSNHVPAVDDDVAFVVVGGYEYTPGMNQPSIATVRELTRRHRVLNVHSESHGSVLRRLEGRAGHMDAGDVARTIFGSMRPRRVEERLWLSPVRGLASIGPLSVPEIMRRRNARLFGRVIRGWLDAIGAPECILIFYWWAVPEIVNTVPHLASIYDCIDDHTALPGGRVPARVVTRVEGRLLDAVDHTFVVSPALLEGRTAPHRRISVLPNALDLRFFEGLERAGWTVPEGVRNVASPIIGYAGGLTDRMNWELVTDVAARRPEWNFVFVGGDPLAAPAALREQPNAFFQSSVPYPEALGAISRFDVATIPAKVQRFSRGNSFLKLLDYFAHGKPVVAPPLPDTLAVAEAHPGLLAIADGVDAWETALAAALAEPPSAPAREARRDYVQQRSAERRVARMLNETLGPRSDRG